MKWKHFPRYWSFVRGIHRWPVNSPQKGQWRGTLMFSLICTWINGWVNNGEADDLGRHRTHYDVIVMVHNFPQQNIVCRMSAFMFRPQGVNTPRGTDTRNTGPCPTCHLDTTLSICKHFRLGSQFMKKACNYDNRSQMVSNYSLFVRDVHWNHDAGCRIFCTNSSILSRWQTYSQTNHDWNTWCHVDVIEIDTASE